MNYRSILFGITALLVCAGLQAQDLKPVKDKATKLFGYQDKSKNWVIAPAFNAAKRFSNGYAIVEQEKQKGVIDESGSWVLPPEFKAINFDKNDAVFVAQRDVELEVVGFKSLWGVYGIDGKEYCEPQFLYAPSFTNGRAVAKDAYTGLKGVISREGRELLPFNNLAVSGSFGGYDVLTEDFVERFYDSNLMPTSEFVYPGYVFPYDAMDDPVRAAAWHKWPIGYRFHRNNIREVEINRNAHFGSATCRHLPIDWGYERFIRLEPVRDSLVHSGSMLNPETGEFYTVKAVLCERNGQPVADLASWGWLDGYCNEGLIYCAEGRESWMLMHDVNCPAVPVFSTPLTGYRKIDTSDIQSALDVRSYDIARLFDPFRAADRNLEIIEGENLGISTRLERPAPELRMINTLNKISRAPLFHRPFRMGQVVNCRVMHKGDETEIELSDRLVCKIEDRFEHPSYSFRGEEELYWGPNNAYTVWLSLEPVHKAPELVDDDAFGTDRSFEVVLALYDERDVYIRTIATAPAPDYWVNGVLVFEPLGLAVITDHNGYKAKHGGRISTTEPRLPAKLSVLLGLNAGK